MKLYIPISILLVVLFFVFIQDLKNRTIHIVLPILIFVLGIIINHLSVDLSFSQIFYNTGFILINILGLVLYFSLKNRTFVNPIDKSIGLGDIVFFIAIVPLFNFRTFIIFFIAGLLFSLIIQLIINGVSKKKTTIPLAGYLSLFLVLNILAKNILKIDLTF